MVNDTPPMVTTRPDMKLACVKISQMRKIGKDPKCFSMKDENKYNDDANNDDGEDYNDDDNNDDDEGVGDT